MREKVLHYLAEHRKALFLSLLATVLGTFALRSISTKLNDSSLAKATQSVTENSASSAPQSSSTNSNYQQGKLPRSLSMSDDEEGSDYSNARVYDGISLGAVSNGAVSNSVTSLSAANAVGGMGQTAEISAPTQIIPARHNRNKHEQHSPPQKNEQQSEEVEAYGVGQKIIKNANVTCRVENFDAASKRFKQILQESGAAETGFNQTNTNGVFTATLTARIRSEKFDELMDKLLTVPVYIEFKNVTAEDVTEEFVDGVARLKTKKEVVARLTGLMAKATRMKDIIELESNIRTVQEEIETVEGRLKYLQNQVMYSTITLRYSEKTIIVSQPSETFGGKFGKALKSGWDTLLDVVLAFVSNWSLWLLLAALFFLAWRWLKNLDAKMKKQKEQSVQAKQAAQEMKKEAAIEQQTNNSTEELTL